MKLLIAILLCAACNTLPHVEPAPRAPHSRDVATVRVVADCVSEMPGSESIEWSPEKIATGVVVSEAHVLTAEHAVFCPTIPSAEVWLDPDRRFRMDVIHDDVMFGGGADIAELRAIGELDRFGLHVAPPKLGRAAIDDVVCVAPYLRPESCGVIDGRDQIVVEMRHGDSGAPVYNAAGELVGIVSRGGEGHTLYAPIDARWLEGT